MVRPHDDLALEITPAWNGQQRNDVGHSDRPQKRKHDFDSDELPSRREYVVGAQLARADVVEKSSRRSKGSRLAGRPRWEGRGQVIEDKKAVAQNLFDYYRKAPQLARYVHIGLDAAGIPASADCERAAQKMVVVRIDLA